MAGGQNSKLSTRFFSKMTPFLAGRRRHPRELLLRRLASKLPAFTAGFCVGYVCFFSPPAAPTLSTELLSPPVVADIQSKPNRSTDVGDYVLRNINDFHDVFTSTDKTFRHGYHWFYGRHLPGYKAKKDLAILEIGGRTGDSAYAWSKYFGAHANIDMVTYGGKNDNHKFENPTINCKGGGDEKNCGRIHTFYCDQSDTEKLEKEVIGARPGGWDLSSIMDLMSLLIT